MRAHGNPIGWRAALAILGRFAFFGPLIGGAPYVWTIFAIPYAYAFGLGPALICGALTIWWLRMGGSRAALPGPWHAAAFGALFGAVGAVLIQVTAAMIARRSLDVFEAITRTNFGHWIQLFFILPHAVVAGSIMAAVTVRRLARPSGPAKPSIAPGDNSALRRSP
jgi:hypothetical protein